MMHGGTITTSTYADNGTYGGDATATVTVTGNRPTQIILVGIDYGWSRSPLEGTLADLQRAAARLAAVPDLGPWSHIRRARAAALRGAGPPAPHREPAPVRTMHGTSRRSACALVNRRWDGAHTGALR